MVPRRYRGDRFLRASAQGLPSRQKTPIHTRRKGDIPNISLNRSRKWAFSGRVENNFLPLDDRTFVAGEGGDQLPFDGSGRLYNARSISHSRRPPRRPRTQKILIV